MISNEPNRYSLEMGDQARAEFNAYITNYIAELNSKLIKIEEQLKIVNIISSVVQSDKGIEGLLDYQEQITLFDRSLEADLAKLRFFIEEDAKELPQYQMLIDRIKNNNVVLNCLSSKNTLQNERESYLKLIANCEAILKGENYNFSLLLDLLLNSTLTDSSRIALLCQEAYKSSRYVVVKEPKKREYVRRRKTEGESLNESVDLTIPIAEYNQLINEVEELIKKHLKLTSGKNVDDFRYAQIFIDYMKEERNNPTDEAIDLNDLRNVEAALVLGLLILIDTKAELGKLIKDINEPSAASREEAEYVELFLKDLKEYYAFASEAATRYEAGFQEATNSPLSNVIFLLDNDGKPIVDIPDNSQENKKRAAALIVKLNNGKYDHSRRVAHSRVVTRSDINLDIFVNRDPVMACAYVRLSDSLALVLCLGAVEEIYDEAQRHFRRNAEVINKLKAIAATKASELINSNQETNNYVISLLGIREEGLNI